MEMYGNVWNFKVTLTNNIEDFGHTAEKTDCLFAAGMGIMPANRNED